MNLDRSFKAGKGAVHHMAVAGATVESAQGTEFN